MPLKTGAQSKLRFVGYCIIHPGLMISDKPSFVLQL